MSSVVAENKNEVLAILPLIREALDASTDAKIEATSRKLVLTIEADVMAILLKSKIKAAAG